VAALEKPAVAPAGGGLAFVRADAATFVALPNVPEKVTSFQGVAVPPDGVAVMLLNVPVKLSLAKLTVMSALPFRLPPWTVPVGDGSQ
jgi:hypothetical protein